MAFFSRDPFARFWKWFTTNEERLYQFERNQNAVFEELSFALKKIDANLTFEFGPVIDGRREFVISAGGIRDAFPLVERLASRAPSLPRWKFIAFRPRREVVLDVHLPGLKVVAAEVRFVAWSEDERIGIVLLIPNFKETPERVFEQAGYLLLDEALGEFAVETRVGTIEIAAPTPERLAKSKPLSDLAATVDAWKAP